MNGVFIDSNIFLKLLEGDSKVKNNFIRLTLENKLFRNTIVYSEVVYVFLRLSTGKKSFELKNMPALIQSKSNELKKVEALLNLAETLPLNSVIEKDSMHFVIEYGLLPNDALIAAACKYHDINKIATLDEDFERVEFLEIIKL